MTQTKKAKEKTMRAVALDRFGGPETLKVQTLPVPEPGADEILIHVDPEGQTDRSTLLPPAITERAG